MNANVTRQFVTMSVFGHVLRQGSSVEDHAWPPQYPRMAFLNCKWVDRKKLPESARILNLTHRLWEIDMHLVSREIVQASVASVQSSPGDVAVAVVMLNCEIWRQAVSITPSTRLRSSNAKDANSARPLSCWNFRPKNNC